MSAYASFIKSAVKVTEPVVGSILNGDLDGSPKYCGYNVSNKTLSLYTN